MYFRAEKCVQGYFAQMLYLEWNNSVFKAFNKTILTYTFNGLVLMVHGKLQFKVPTKQQVCKNWVGVTYKHYLVVHSLRSFSYNSIIIVI